MKNVTIQTSPDKRIENAVRKAIQIYLSRIYNKFYEIGLEDTFKLYLGNIIATELELNTFSPTERFFVMFEKNMPINNHNDYVDIVIKYKNQNVIKLYPIELKFKKITDSAPDLGNLVSYIDIYNLDRHKAITKNVCGCYYIFMTDLETYTKKSFKGTRTEIPMHDGYTIQKNKSYTVSGATAKKNLAKYPNGLIFNNDYTIEYEKVIIDKKPYWYYILKL